MKDDLEQALRAQTRHALELEIHELLERGTSMVQTCTVAAHLLHRRGAGAPGWQPLFALGCWSALRDGHGLLALRLAWIGGVQRDVRQLLPTVDATSRRAETRALALVLQATADRGAASETTGSIMDAVAEGAAEDIYLRLPAVIRAARWDDVAALLEGLGRALEADDRPAWDPYSYPGYELEPTTLAAICRARGMDLTLVRQPFRDWLWPAVEAEDGIRPIVWPFPAGGGGVGSPRPQ